MDWLKNAAFLKHNLPTSQYDTRAIIHLSLHLIFKQMFVILKRTFLFSEHGSEKLNHKEWISTHVLLVLHNLGQFTLYKTQLIIHSGVYMCIKSKMLQVMLYLNKIEIKNEIYSLLNLFWKSGKPLHIFLLCFFNCEMVWSIFNIKNAYLTDVTVTLLNPAVLLYISVNWKYFSRWDRFNIINLYSKRMRIWWTKTTY